MTPFLSPAWFADRAAAPPDPNAVELTIQQRVTDGPDGEVAYVLRLAGGSVIIEPGQAEYPDVTITETYETALAIHEGRLSPAAAVAAGQVRVGGAVNLLLEHGAALEASRG